MSSLKAFKGVQHSLAAAASVHCHASVLSADRKHWFWWGLLGQSQKITSWNLEQRLQYIPQRETICKDGPSRLLTWTTAVVHRPTLLCKSDKLWGYTMAAAAGPLVGQWECGDESGGGARSVVTPGLWSVRSTGVWSVAWETSLAASCRNLKHPLLIVLQNRTHTGARTRTHTRARQHSMM